MRASTVGSTWCGLQAFTSHALLCCGAVTTHTHRAAVRALVAVVDGARKAGLAERVPARRRDRLVQQLHAEDALQIVRATVDRARPAPVERHLLGPKVWFLLTVQQLHARNTEQANHIAVHQAVAVQAGNMRC